MKGRPPRGPLVCPACGARFHRELWRSRHRRRHGKRFWPRPTWVMRSYVMSAAEVEERFGVTP